MYSSTAGNKIALFNHYDIFRYLIRDPCSLIDIKYYINDS